jgi:DNA-binding transcriptional ArsR family regulator
MEVYSALATIVNRLAALAQPHRLAVFRLLVVAGPKGRAAGDIAEAVGLPASTLSFHLAHLKRAGLVTAARRPIPALRRRFRSDARAGRFPD